MTKTIKKIAKVILLLLIFAMIMTFFIDRYISAEIIKSYESSQQYQQGTFRNEVPDTPHSIMKTFGILKRFITEKKVDGEPDGSLPQSLLTRKELNELSNDQIFIVKLGHSSLLLKVYGKYWLIDPIFSQRASPFSFMGPKRFQNTPISIEELPNIERVLISHNHYDHLDKNSIINLAGKTQQFLVPLGIEGDLQSWGITKEKIINFDWWQELQSEGILVALTPAQHFSGRGLSDRNTTLWGSWVIKTSHERFFFSGDSGYFDGFKKIGHKYGPFDITFIETGAYNSDWPTVHMLPEMSVQAHLDLQGKVMVPIHNSTFDLAFHPWYEPLERVLAAAKAHNVKLSTPINGEIINSKNIDSDDRWWKDHLKN